MKKNIGNLDRLLRVIVAAIIVALYFMHIISGTMAIVLIAFAIIFMITSSLSFCPLYLPFGISTRKEDNK